MAAPTLPSYPPHVAGHARRHVDTRAIVFAAMAVALFVLDVLAYLAIPGLPGAPRYR